jgi:hypothetical protein
MKKLICLVLVFWLPLFFVAANAMALEMALPSHVKTSSAMEMPCHNTQHNQHQSDLPSSKHHCAVCGFCVIGGGTVFICQTTLFYFGRAQNTAPLFFALHSLSQTYPPAIKPPIVS